MFCVALPPAVLMCPVQKEKGGDKEKTGSGAADKSGGSSKSSDRKDGTPGKPAAAAGNASGAKPAESTTGKAEFKTIDVSKRCLHWWNVGGG